MTSHLPDLASRALGASVVWANDELFAERQNLINPDPPVFRPHTFGHKGQLMDGWETRRRREPGVDEVIVRLGAAGVIRGIVVDTTHFTGNYPPEASVEACAVDGYPDPAQLRAADWQPIVARGPLDGNAPNEFDVSASDRFTHVKLSIYPDGGVARVRVRGEIVPDPRLLPSCFDVAALENGGHIVGASNVFYSTPGNLIMPGNAAVMGDGWETARRRDDGNDWVDLALGCEAVLRIAELDTSHFVGNAPGWARLSTPDGREVLPRTRLQPDTRHRFLVVADVPVDRLRLDIYPDGGLARLRLIGEPTDLGRGRLALRFLDTLPAANLRTCCAADSWLAAIVAGRPYPDLTALFERSDAAIAGLDEAGLAQALAAHPRIGERSSSAGAEAGWSRKEQAGVSSADDLTRAELAAANAEYERRFARVYLVCATGRSATELLAICRARLDNDPVTERAVVLGELAKIVRIRLGRLYR